MTDWLSDFTLDIAMAALLVGYAKGATQGYDLGWCDRDEYIVHNPEYMPEPPNKQITEEMLKAWKLSVADILLNKSIKGVQHEKT